MPYTVAIVGRPNVGKSTLFNRLIGHQQAIVDSEAGVTRDRIYGICQWKEKSMLVIDTGGISTDKADDFQAEIVNQVELAIDEANLILFVVDGQEGLHNVDKEIYDKLRMSQREIVLICNKVDTPDKEWMLNEFYVLGHKNGTFNLSANNGYGTGELLDLITSKFNDSEEVVQSDKLRIAIVGRPNVGKSTFLNVLTGKTRSVVSDKAGTTRDSLETEFNLFGKEIILVDTAGLRKKGKASNDLDYYASIRTIKAIRASDVCMLLIDVEEGITSQDLGIFREIEEANKGVVVLVNKWDLIESRSEAMNSIKAEVQRRLSPFSDVPIFFTSSKTRQRMLKALERAIEVGENRKKRIPTKLLNEKILPEIRKYPPPVYKSKEVSIKFITQLPTKSPAIAFFCNLPQYIKEPYKRFLENKLREHFDFSGIPVRLYFRQK